MSDRDGSGGHQTGGGQDHPGGLDGDVGARADRDSTVGAGQCRGVDLAMPLLADTRTGAIITVVGLQHQQPRHPRPR
ncbi:hypothetical protein [Micromonospora sp. WMMD1155]|uniref:hypothetical protein n=1 Tax=Micromonospora sp. WMMD1155 TaxID=3016094 RepID=UPI00249ADB58|nr:hypothetical protein [Micromonospora sp. WMMD1155]WFE53064.1 hypothetical protein O7617_23310 [Micromonospora sp. WMMD1155]